MFRKREIEEQVENLIAQRLLAQGVLVVAVEFLKSHQGQVLRVYIDKNSTGVTIEDCSRVHREIETMLEGQVIPDLKYREFQLEVSSPGVHRILKKKDDFQKFSGSEVQLHLYAPLIKEDGSMQKNFTGILRGMKDDKVLLEVDQKIVEILWKDIKSANVKYSFNNS
ncbi:MAG: ribosome maturation factor RimP [Deltaproteobacteria bacterium]|nr:ribosome maturation factor RimP [Deltaproteobacteria bacterium]